MKIRKETQCTRFLRGVSFWPILISFWQLYWVEVNVMSNINSRRIVEAQGTFSSTRNCQTFESVGKWGKMLLESVLKILNLLDFLITNLIRFQIFTEQNSTWEKFKVVYTGVPRKVGSFLNSNLWFFWE